MIVTIAIVAVATAGTLADQVIFKNGDKLSGKLQTLSGGKLKIQSAVAGEIIVDMKDVATLATDAPVELRTADGRTINQAIMAGDQGQVKLADGEALPVERIAQINPPKSAWTGSITVNGAIARGNTNTEELGVKIDASLRRETDRIDDRFTVGAGYNFGRQEDPDTGQKNTTTDRWFAQGKYDRFFNDKLYGYGLAKVEHDRIAGLDWRLSPGVGVGYQWIESPRMNFNTEAGVSYVYEEYDTADTNDFVSVRLSYHFDKQLRQNVSFFHNLEYLPSVEDIADFIITADAGMRVTLTDSFFAEFKFEWQHDSTPAPGAVDDDLRYLLGVGWMF
jgi:putative salt-induced outer membrane protein YdiY